MMPRLKEALPNLTLMALSLMGIHVVIILFWLVWPMTVFEVKRFEVLEKEAPAGSRIVYKLDYCKSGQMLAAATVQYSFIGELNYGLFGQAMSLLPGGCGSIDEVIPVPLLPMGKYKLEMIRTYHLNPMRDIVIRAYSNPFEITEIPDRKVK